MGFVRLFGNQAQDVMQRWQIMMHLCGVLYHLGTSALKLCGVHRLQLHSEVGIGISCIDLFLTLVRVLRSSVLLVMGSVTFAMLATTGEK